MMRRAGPALALAALIGAGGVPGGAAVAGDYSPATNYLLRCSGCHDRDGSGKPGAGIPDFRGYVGAFARLPEGRRYLMHVPGVTNAALTDAEIAATMNYVMTHFAGDSLDPAAPAFTGAEVARLRAEPVPDVVALRRAVAAEFTRRGWPVAAYPWP